MTIASLILSPFILALGLTLVFTPSIISLIQNPTTFKKILQPFLMFVFCFSVLFSVSVLEKSTFEKHEKQLKEFVEKCEPTGGKVLNVRGDLFCVEVKMEGKIK